MKTRKKTLIFIVLILAIFCLTVKNAIGDTGNYYPEHTTDDGFVTDIGAFFGTTGSLPLQSGTSDMQSGVRFQNVNIPQDAKINNATLFVRTLWTFDPGLAYTTIYGVDENNAYEFNSSGDFTRPYTSAYVNWNVSDVTGSSWHNVSVTNIVQEIISRHGWTQNNNLALIILGTEGEPRREFATYDQNIVYRPRLEIYWDVSPTNDTIANIQNQASPPYNDTEDWTFEYNDTYKGIDIYIATEANWLNFSTFTVMGAASARISGLNDTWFQVTNMYTDTDCYMRRNFDDYRDNESDTIGVKFGLKWEGMPWSGVESYEFVNMWGISTDHDQATDFDEGYSYAERTWSDRAMGTAWALSGEILVDSVTWSPLLNEAGLPFTLYYYIRLDLSTRQNQVWVYNDIEMSDLNVTYSEAFTDGPGHPENYLYEYLIAPFVPAGDSTGFTGEYISKFDDLDQVVFLVYPNGTLVTPDPLPEDEDPEDYIDELVGVDPEDPQTDEYGTALTKNRWKTFVFVIGMVMFLGTPTIGIISKAGIGRWYMIIFVSLCGLALLWSLMYM